MFEIFKNIGLTDNEIKVYNYLLEKRKSIASRIAKDLNLNRSMTYSVLESLIQKGLVTYIITNKIKFFNATDPEKLVEYVREKERYFRSQEGEIHKIIPQLRGKLKKKEEEPQIEVFEGLEGFKALLDIIIKEATDKNYYVLGLTGKTHKVIPHFYKHWNKRRLKAGVKRYVISTKKNYDFAKNMPYTEARYLPKEYENPLSVLIWKGKIAIRIWVGNKPFLIAIKNKDVYKAFHAYFRAMWMIAKK